MADQHRKLAELLGGVFKRAAVEAHVETAPIHHAARIEAERAHLDRMEDELAPLIGGIRAALNGDGTLTEAFRALLDEGAEPTHASTFLTVMNDLVLAFSFSVIGALTQPLVQPLVNEQWKAGPTMPLGPAEAALNVLRGYSSEEDGYQEARLSGVDRDRFHTMIENTGEPPAIGEMLLLYRRGQISQGDLERAIKQSRIKPEWIPQVLELRFAPPGAGEAVGAAVEGHLSEDEARTKVGEAGINPENFDWMLATAGRPPGVQQLLGLENRGVVDEATVVAAIRESNIKNKYIPAILRLREKLVPFRSVPSLVAKGIIPPAEGVTKLLQLGYSQADATRVIQGATSTSTAKAKEATEAQWIRGYVEGLLSRDALSGGLAALGYTPEAIGFVVQLADYTRAHQGAAAAVGHTRSAYIARRIDRATAENHLATEGIDAESRAHLLGLWDLAQGEAVTDLTVANLTAAFKKQIILEAEYRARLARHGYSAHDVDILVLLATPAPTVA